MKKKKLLKIVFVVLDILIINIVFILSFYVRFAGHIPFFNFNAYLKTWYLINGFFIFLLYFAGIYNSEEFSIDFFFSFFNAINISYFCIILLYYIFREKIGAFPSTVFLISWFLNLIFLSLIRFFIFRIAFKKNVMIIGKNRAAKDIAGMIRKKSFKFTGFEKADSRLNSLVKKLLGKNIHLVIITQNIKSEKQFYILLDKLSSLGIRILFDISLVDSPVIKTRIFNLGGMMFYEIQWARQKIFQTFLKRNLDIIISLILLIALLPFFLYIIIMIKLDSKGKIFFKQERIGKNYKKFMMYKFRTMIEGAEKKKGPVWANEKDRRATKFGRFLRKTGFDELPQLWNILKGDMSLVGPRPERQYFIDKYPVLMSRRLSVKPGLTGLAQVNSLQLGPEEKTKYDIAYVENQSFLLDMIIIKKTISLIIKRLFYE